MQCAECDVDVPRCAVFARCCKVVLLLTCRTADRLRILAATGDHRSFKGLLKSLLDNESSSFDVNQQGSVSCNLIPQHFS